VPTDVATTLSVQADVDDPFIQYALRLVGYASGVSFRQIPASCRTPRVDLYYGDDARRPCGIRIPRVAAYTVVDIPRVPGVSEFRKATNVEGSFPFDLFSAVRFWLADEGNRAEHTDIDEHGRLVAAGSAQATIGDMEVPIVNAYLALLRTWIEHRVGLRTRAPLPDGKRCVVVLTHDVDNPIGPGDPRHRLWLAARNVRRARPRRALADLRIAAQKIRPARPRRATWLFRDIIEAEESRGFRSTFFFAPIPNFSPAGHGLDVDYDLSAPRFRRVCRELSARGAEIGLHVSYSAVADPKRIAAERSLVEATAGETVRGCRHHYFHMSRPFWDSLEAHGAAGLQYDSSVSFREEPGFRLGLALVTELWNPVAQRTIPVLQIPPMAMDGAFYYNPAQTLGDTLERFERLIAALKRFEGVAALDWHEYTSTPLSSTHGHWGEGYRAILDLLASDAEVAVQTGHEAAALSSARMTASEFTP
jgi:hypothetical protein